MNPLTVAIMGIGLAILMIILAVRFGKHFFKIFSIVLLLGFLVLIIYMGFVVDDANSFKDGIVYQHNLILLEKNGTVLSAIQLNALAKSTAADIYSRTFANGSNQEIRYKGNLQDPLEPESTFSFMSKAKIDSFNRLYAAENYDAIIEDYYKMIVFNYSLFDENRGKIINLGYYQIAVGDCLELIESSDPFNELVREIAAKNYEVPNDVAAKLTEYEPNFRSALFALMLAEVLEGGERDATQIFLMLKEGEVYVYPETLSIKFMKGMSVGTVDYIFQQIEKQASQE